MIADCSLTLVSGRRLLFVELFFFIQRFFGSVFVYPVIRFKKLIDELIIYF